MSGKVIQNPMEIQTVTIVGLGTISTLFGNLLSQRIFKKNLCILTDPVRIALYRQNGVFSNGEPYDFQYVATADALQAIRIHVGENTLILSLLNGIGSEGHITEMYGRENVVDCVAYGIDAVKEGNRLSYHNTGKLCIGAKISGQPTEQVRRIARFFEMASVPYEISINTARSLTVL